MMGSEPLRRLMGWLGSVKSHREGKVGGAVGRGSLDVNRDRQQREEKQKEK
jgi:hypothetical protein